MPSVVMPIRPMALTTIPAAASAPGAMAVGVGAGQRRGDQHAQRERRELDAGQDRVVAQRALEVQDEDEGQREAREAGQERGAGRGGEAAVGKEREVEHRRRRTALDDQERRKQDGGEHERDDRVRVVPADDPAARDPIGQTGEAHHEGDRPWPVEAVLDFGRDELAQHERRPQRAGDPERHVEPEDPVPGDLDQRAAEHRPEDEADARDHHVGAHRDAELLAGEGVGDQRAGVGEQQRAADALHDPPEDQVGAAGREARAQRGGGEDARSRRRRRACGRRGR